MRDPDRATLATRREDAVDRFRKLLGRRFGRWFARRDGWFFVLRRAVASLLTDASRVGPSPKGYEVLSPEDVAQSGPGARLHRPEPGYPVVELTQGLVFGPKGHIGATSQHIVAELSVALRGKGDRRILRECARSTLGDTVALPGVTANLCQDSFGNYCHWMLQGFERLELLERTVGTAGIDRFLVTPRIPAFVYEALATHGIDRARVVEVPDAPRVYRCAHLVAAGLPRRTRDVPRWVLDDVRARFGTPPAPGSPRRVYLARGATARRRVVNEAAVVEALNARGFVPLTMDGLTITEQASIAAAADCIVGPHGAALTNLVFARPDTAVVELTNKNLRDTTFANLAAQVELRYCAVDGLEPAVPPWLRRGLSDADIVVDVGALTRTLDELDVR